MLAATCAFLFIAAALVAIGAIGATWATYAADIARLRSLRYVPVTFQNVSWRIMPPAPAGDMAGYNLRPSTPSTRPARRLAA